jgi:hypothetical protein
VAKPRRGELVSRSFESSKGVDVLARDRAAEIDAAYAAAYADHPLDEPDSVESVSVGLLVERLGRLSDSRMRAICGALEVAIDCR